MNRAAGIPLPDTSPMKKANRPSGKGKKSYRSPDTCRAGWTRGKQLEAGIAERIEVGGQIALLNLAGQRQFLMQFLLFDAGGVQGRVFQHDADLESEGRQHFQVFVAERHTGRGAVELNDALSGGRPEQ